MTDSPLFSRPVSGAAAGHVAATAGLSILGALSGLGVAGAVASATFSTVLAGITAVSGDRDRARIAHEIELIRAEISALKGGSLAGESPLSLSEAEGALLLAICREAMTTGWDNFVRTEVMIADTQMSYAEASGHIELLDLKGCVTRPSAKSFGPHGTGFSGATPTGLGCLACWILGGDDPVSVTRDCFVVLADVGTGADEGDRIQLKSLTTRTGVPLVRLAWVCRYLQSRGLVEAKRLAGQAMPAVVEITAEGRMFLQGRTARGHG